MDVTAVSLYSVLVVLPGVRAMTHVRAISFGGLKTYKQTFLYIIVCISVAHFWFYLFKVCKFSWVGQAPTVARVASVTEGCKAWALHLSVWLALLWVSCAG